MTTLRITDQPDSQARREIFFGGSLRVFSRSGLHRAESLLLSELERLNASPSSLLVAGNRTGVTALAAASRFPSCRITAHVFDLHHFRAVQRNWRMNGTHAAPLFDPFVLPPEDLAAAPEAPLAAARLACTAAIPEGPYDLALFMATPGTSTGELILDQLEDIHESLAPGGVCLLACEAEAEPLLKHVKAIFGSVSAHLQQKDLLCARAVKQAPLAKRRDFSATFRASLPGLPPLALKSLPGVFCHRRPDSGGLALAELAAREPADGQKILDLGCGCGLVGLLLASQSPGARVTFVDSHARALAATHFNLAALAPAGHELRLSDTGTAQSGFDLFVGNPPYYSDFRIAQLFIDTAHRALRSQGRCLLVAKSAGKLQELLLARFGNAERLSRRGYGVVRCVKTS
jgi:16S rRNA (guanine1207-N2)-methyltransferase